MPRYTFDVYAVATLDIVAPTEAAARKMLDNDDYGQEMEPISGPVGLACGRALPLPTTLHGLSYRKIWASVCVVDDEGTLTDTESAHHGDGPVAELETPRAQHYCATDDRVNTLDDGEGWEGYCGTCADIRAADAYDL